MPEIPLDTTVSPTLLSDIPDVVVENARNMARNDGETLVGYKAITAPDGPHRVKPVRWMVVTDRGYYEVDPDGTFQRAAVLHHFPEGD